MAKDSLDKIGVCFAESKQARSANALGNLIEAAEKIVDQGDANGFTARNLARISGHSLGSLVQRLGKVENIFLYAIAYSRTKHLAVLAGYLESFGNDKTAAQFCEYIVDIAMNRMMLVGAPVIRYYESRAMGRTNNVGNIYAYTDEIVPALKKMIRQNTTGTFRDYTDYEIKYLARLVCQIFERPLVEGDPQAGTAQHREMVMNILSGLFCAR